MGSRLGELMTRLAARLARRSPLAEDSVGSGLTLSFDYERGFAGEDPEAADRGLEAALAILAERRVKATFNCVARIVEIAPHRIEQVTAAGHEVACHGYAHESPRDLDAAALGSMLARCGQAFGVVGVRPIGFRSPQSHWDERLLDELAAAGFLYSAEHDKSPRPYLVKPAPRPVWRMPVRTDDWDYVRHDAPAERLVAKHSAVIAGLARGGTTALGFHPWLLADRPDRHDALRALIDLARTLCVRIAPFRDMVPFWPSGNPMSNDS